MDQVFEHMPEIRQHTKPPGPRFDHEGRSIDSIMGCCYGVHQYIAEGELVAGAEMPHVRQFAEAASGGGSRKGCRGNIDRDAEFPLIDPSVSDMIAVVV